jgi:hypothetical protein
MCPCSIAPPDISSAVALTLEVTMRCTLILALGLPFLAAGCADNTKPEPSPHALQKAALEHPFDYSPDINTSISGGGFMDFDHNAFKHDIKSVFDP